MRNDELTIRLKEKERKSFALFPFYENYFCLSGNTLKLFDSTTLTAGKPVGGFSVYKKAHFSYEKAHFSHRVFDFYFG